MTVTATTTVMADARATINGRPSWHIAGGRLDGYWLAESAMAFKPGSIERLELPAGPSIDISAGTHTGYRYSAQGGVIGSRTVHYGTARTVSVSAWKIVNGRPHFLVGSGALNGTWLPESSCHPPPRLTRASEHSRPQRSRTHPRWYQTDRAMARHGWGWVGWNASTDTALPEDPPVCNDARSPR